MPFDSDGETYNWMFDVCDCYSALQDYFRRDWRTRSVAKQLAACEYRAGGGCNWENYIRDEDQGERFDEVLQAHGYAPRWATAIAEQWAGGENSVLYQFSSWRGVVVSEAHRINCIGEIERSIHWCDSEGLESEAAELRTLVAYVGTAPIKGIE